MLNYAVAKQSEDLPAVVAKSLDEWVQQIREKVTPNRFPSLHREAWTYAFKKYNSAVSSSAAVERVFSVGSGVLRQSRRQTSRLRRAKCLSGGGQSLKLSSKVAVFKRVSLLIEGAKHVDWGASVGRGITHCSD